MLLPEHRNSGACHPKLPSTLHYGFYVMSQPSTTDLPESLSDQRIIRKFVELMLQNNVHYLHFLCLSRWLSLIEPIQYVRDCPPLRQELTHTSSEIMCMAETAPRWVRALAFSKSTCRVCNSLIVLDIFYKTLHGLLFLACNNWICGVLETRDCSDCFHFSVNVVTLWQGRWA